MEKKAHKRKLSIPAVPTPTLPQSLTINRRRTQCEAEDRSLSTSHLSDRLRFWADRENIYDKLSLVAEDIVSAPASQAYVERESVRSVACSPLVAEIERPSHLR